MLARGHAEELADLQEENLAFELRNREREVERQRLVVSELQRQVDDLAIRASVAGLVSRIDVEDHDAVAANQPLITVVDLSAFEVEIQIPEGYADEISAATPAVIRFGNGEYEGTVKSVSPEVEGTQVRGIVAFSGTPPEGLRQNQRVNARLILETRDDVLKVGRGPFVESGGGRAAYLLDGNMAERVEIRVGATSVSEVEILSGLSEGDRIIISDSTRFEEAKRIFLRQ